MSGSGEENQRKFYTVVACQRVGNEESDSEIWQTPEIWLEVDENQLLWAYYPYKNRQSCARNYLARGHHLGGKQWGVYKVTSLYYPEVHTTSYELAEKFCRAIGERPVTDEETRAKQLKNAVMAFRTSNVLEERNRSESDSDDTFKESYDPRKELKRRRVDIKKPVVRRRDTGCTNGQQNVQDTDNDMVQIGKKKAVSPGQVGAVTVPNEPASNFEHVPAHSSVAKTLSSSIVASPNSAAMISARPTLPAVFCAPSSVQRPSLSPIATTPTSGRSQYTPVSVSTPVGLPPSLVNQMSARVTTADIMKMLVRIDQKLERINEDVKKISGDNVAIRHDLVLLKQQYGLSKKITGAAVGALSHSSEILHTLDLDRKIQDTLPVDNRENFVELERWLTEGADETLAARSNQLKDYLTRRTFGISEKEFAQQALKCAFTKKFANLYLSWAGSKGNKEFILKKSKVWGLLADVIGIKYPLFQKNIGTYFNNFHKDAMKGGKKVNICHADFDRLVSEGNENTFPAEPQTASLVDVEGGEKP